MCKDPIRLLGSYFGYRRFRPGQEELVRAALGGRDALGILPTGGGKSVCYQLPALTLGGLTLVVTPLVSLMEDQVRRAAAVGLRAARLSSGQSASDRRATLSAAADGALDMLLVSPERLEVPSFRQALLRLDVRLLAVDEAHCISEWGHDFRPSYRRIGAVRSALCCPLLALTATATPQVRADICRNLTLKDPVVVVRSFDRPNLSWSVGRGGSLLERASRICEILAKRAGVAIVYAPTRRTVELTRDRLARRGIRAAAYHAGLPSEERTRVQWAFLEDSLRVVVATNAFGMGIDKSDVRVVAHLQMPLSLEAYYQEAGRAGRDGDRAECVAFRGPGDRHRSRTMLSRSNPSVCQLKRAMKQLRRAADHSGLVRPQSALVDRRGRTLGAEALSGLLRALMRLNLVVPAAVAGEGGTDPALEVSLWVLQNGPLELSSAAARRRQVLAQLAAVQRYARSRGCRRRTLLRYFGEEAARNCGMCDRCAPVLTIE